MPRSRKGKGKKHQKKKGAGKRSSNKSRAKESLQPTSSELVPFQGANLPNSSDEATGEVLMGRSFQQPQSSQQRSPQRRGNRYRNHNVRGKPDDVEELRKKMYEVELDDEDDTSSDDSDSDEEYCDFEDMQALFLLTLLVNRRMMFGGCPGCPNCAPRYRGRGRRGPRYMNKPLPRAPPKSKGNSKKQGVTIKEIVEPENSGDN